MKCICLLARGASEHVVLGELHDMDFGDGVGEIVEVETRTLKSLQ